MAQVMQRMRLTWFGDYGDEHSTRNTFTIIVTIVVAYLVFINALEIYIKSVILNNQELNQFVLTVHDFGTFIFWFWSIIALCKTRRSVRVTYSIPGSDCEDCMTALSVVVVQVSCYEGRVCDAETQAFKSIWLSLFHFSFIILIFLKSCKSFTAVVHVTRHTGEFETYPVKCCSKTGLDPHAPMAV